MAAKKCKRARVSDHALVRFIERVHGIDLDDIRSELLSDVVISGMKAGATKIHLSDCTLIIKGYTIVTVVER